MTTISYTGQFVTYTAKSTGTYDIVAYGAEGGGVKGGGYGAEIGGNVMLTAGETLTIAVGGRRGRPWLPAMAWFASQRTAALRGTSCR